MSVWAPALDALSGKDEADAGPPALRVRGEGHLPAQLGAAVHPRTVVYKIRAPLVIHSYAARDLHQSLQTKVASSVCRVIEAAVEGPHPPVQ